MRRSPRRPLILKRRKLPFQQNEAAESQSKAGEPCAKEPAKTYSPQTFPDGIRIMDHPSMSGTQVVVIPKTADLQSVIGALTAKGKESGAQGPNKFILLSGNDGQDNKPSTKSGVDPDGTLARTPGAQSVKEKSLHNPGEAKNLTGLKPMSKDGVGGPLDESLTNIQWLGKMSTCGPELDSSAYTVSKEKQSSTPQTYKAHGPRAPAEAAQQPVSERPPYSYMAMIQFAINGGKDRRMTLKEIYTWIEDHFPYYRDVAKPGWKNSVRHNLSLHDMFIRETSPDDKTSFWTIRPEANRCLTLDHVYQPGCDPMTTPVPVPMLVLSHQHQKMLPDARKTSTGYERRMKPLLPRTDSYLLPIQLPVTPALYLPSPPTPFPIASFQPKRSTPRESKRVRIAPKVGQNDPSAALKSPQSNKVVKVQVKEDSLCAPIKETPKVTPKRQVSSSRRKQHLARSLHEEPVLLCPDNTFFDSGVASDVSTVHDVRDTELDDHQDSPDRHFSFKTPIKSSSQLTSSTPSKPACSVASEPWKVTPVGKKSQSVLDFSPIRTPSGPPVSPQQDYSNLSFGSTPFTDSPLFNSPSELLTSASSRAGRALEPTSEHLQRDLPREYLMAGGSATTNAANHSLTEGLVLDTMNESLSKIFVDVSFSGLEDEEFDMSNISWSEFFPQLK